MPSARPFYVIQRLVSCVYFDARTGSWRKSLEDVQHYRTEEGARAAALEWCLDDGDESHIVRYRITPNPRPQPCEPETPSDEL